MMYVNDDENDDNTDAICAPEIKTMGLMMINFNELGLVWKNLTTKKWKK